MQVFVKKRQGCHPETRMPVKTTLASDHHQSSELMSHSLPFRLLDVLELLMFPVTEF